MCARRHDAGVITALAALSLALPLAAQPVSRIDTPPEGAAVIDIRDETACLRASLANARCLPAAWILGADGNTPVGFHALRWLLGTVGLSGAEPVVVYADETGADAAWAVGALAWLAGQAEVHVFEGESEEITRGESRSLSREVVYTAPMRLRDLTAQPGAERDLSRRLTEFAKTGGTIAFPPEL
jgi:hypothetical protein